MAIGADRRGDMWLGESIVSNTFTSLVLVKYLLKLYLYDSELSA